MNVAVCLLGLLALAAPVLSTPVQDSADESAGARAIRPDDAVTLLGLTEVPRGRAVHQFSSRNKEGQNGDDGWHLYADKHGHAVVFDAAGPGCVRSIWSTDIREDAVFHFYFDGEQEARYSIPMIGFYQGEHELFPSPLVSYERRGYWGDRPFAGNCFVPIPFAEGLKVTVSGELHFYHFLWESYPHGTLIETFTGAEDRSFVAEAFRGADPISREVEGQLKMTRAKSIEPGAEISLGDFEAPGCVREIVIEGPSVDELIRETWIQMVWDGHDRHDVNAPLGYFFGSAVKATAMQSLPLTVVPLEGDRVRLTCRFPMPFTGSARLNLVNRSGASLGPIRALVRVVPEAPAEDRLAYFTTLFREGWTTYGRDWLLAETPGTGWYVGTVQTMLGEHYCEGDEHIALDGVVSPQINGTGSEDYYLGCFWPNQEFNSPFACCVGDIHEEAGSFQGSYGIRSCYSRYHLEAPIPFYSHLDARIQHGGYDTIRSSYGSLAFYYLRARSALLETDYLDVGNPTSEQAHGYQAEGSELTGPIVARGEGRHHLIEHRARGRRHGAGEISFTVAIDPENQGVRLRRRLDQESPRQTARVFFDGEPVGIWYHADHNPTLRWLDSDFDVHPRFTRGKNRLAVRLVVSAEDGLGSFTDFDYRVLSLIE